MDIDNIASSVLQKLAKCGTGKSAKMKAGKSAKQSLSLLRKAGWGQ
jgi:hypothetical protein